MRKTMAKASYFDASYPRGSLYEKEPTKGSLKTAMEKLGALSKRSLVGKGSIGVAVVHGGHFRSPHVLSNQGIPPTPPIFDGLPSRNFLLWLCEIKGYFLRHYILESMKCELAVSCLKGPALIWYDCLNLSRRMEGKRGITSWHKLEFHMKKRFTFSCTMSDLTTQLETLKQNPLNINKNAKPNTQPLPEMKPKLKDIQTSPTPKPEANEQAILKTTFPHNEMNPLVNKKTKPKTSQQKLLSDCEVIKTCEECQSMCQGDMESKPKFNEPTELKMNCSSNVENLVSNACIAEYLTPIGSGNLSDDHERSDEGIDLTHSKPLQLPNNDLIPTHCESKDQSPNLNPKEAICCVSTNLQQNSQPNFYFTTEFHESITNTIENENLLVESSPVCEGTDVYGDHEDEVLLEPCLGVLVEDNVCVKPGILINLVEGFYDEVSHVNVAYTENYLNSIESMGVQCHEKKDVSPVLAPSTREEQSDTSLVQVSGGTHENGVAVQGFILSTYMSPLDLYINKRLQQPLSLKMDQFLTSLGDKKCWSPNKNEPKEHTYFNCSKIPSFIPHIKNCPDFSHGCLRNLKCILSMPHFHFYMLRRMKISLVQLSATSYTLAWSSSEHGTVIYVLPRWFLLIYDPGGVNHDSHLRMQKVLTPLHLWSQNGYVVKEVVSFIHQNLRSNSFEPGEVAAGARPMGLSNFVQGDVHKVMPSNETLWCPYFDQKRRTNSLKHSRHAPEFQLTSKDHKWSFPQWKCILFASTKSWASLLSNRVGISKV